MRLAPMLRRPRKLPPKEWKYDWRNPDMLVHTGWLERDMFGGLTRVRADVTPEVAQQIARESLEDSSRPTWDKDKTYY